ncbi:MAG: ABC transporter permease [Planctomycetia bacterium]|nr:ABC transporter permease [Planctomycetia bacterium]
MNLEQRTLGSFGARTAQALASRAWSFLAPFVGLLVVLSVIQTYHLIWKPDNPFLKTHQLQLIAKQTAIVGVGALGMTVIIVSGGIDLSAGSMIALTSVLLAVLLRREVPACLDDYPRIAASWQALALDRLPVTLAVFFVLLAGAAAGALNGVLITGLRLVPFIVTLGAMLIYRGMAEWLADQKKVMVVGDHVPDWLTTLLDAPTSPWQLVCYGVWIVVLLGILLAAVMRYTVFGRYVFAIGSNEPTARLCGIHVPRMKIAIYALGGVFMALAGIFDFNNLSAQGNPTSGEGLELDMIAAVVIGGGSLSGGRGSILGSIIGALTMTTLRSGCVYAGMSNPVQKLLIGAIIIAAVAIDQGLHRGRK